MGLTGCEGAGIRLGQVGNMNLQRKGQRAQDHMSSTCLCEWVCTCVCVDTHAPVCVRQDWESGCGLAGDQPEGPGGPTRTGSVHSD